MDNKELYDIDKDTIRQSFKKYKKVFYDREVGQFVYKKKDGDNTIVEKMGTAFNCIVCLTTNKFTAFKDNKCILDTQEFLSSKGKLLLNLRAGDDNDYKKYIPAEEVRSLYGDDKTNLKFAQTLFIFSQQLQEVFKIDVMGASLGSENDEKQKDSSIGQGFYDYRSHFTEEKPMFKALTRISITSDSFVDSKTKEKIDYNKMVFSEVDSEAISQREIDECVNQRLEIGSYIKGSVKNIANKEESTPKSDEGDNNTMVENKPF